MGLDFVELIMAIEDRFEITIEEEDFIQIRCVGHLCDYVMEKRFGREVQGSPEEEALVRLQRGLGSVLAIDLASVRHSTPIAELIPRKSRRHCWKLLQQHLSLELPPLTTHPNRMIAAVSLLGCVLVVAAAVVLATITGRWAQMIGLAGLAVAAVGLIGYLLATRMPTLPAPEFQTVGGLAKGLVSYNYEEFSAAVPLTDENEEVWQAVCEVVADVLGVRREELSRASRFIEDLGAC